MRSDILIADFESSTGNVDGSTNVYLWGISSLDKKDRYIGVHIKDMFATAFHYKLKKVMFHNLSWDGEFIIHWLIKQGYKPAQGLFDDPKDDMTFTRMKTDMGVVFSIKVKNNGHIIQFGDTAKLLVSSVDKMGEMLGLPKLKIDYDKYKYFDKIEDVPAELIEYLWRDIDIVIDIYTVFKKQFKYHGITLGATALKSYKKHLGNWEYVKRFGGRMHDFKTSKKTYHEVLTKEQWDEFKKSYRGGLTVFRKDYIGVEINTKDGYSADYNSMYPSVMEKYLYPVGKPYEYPILGSNVLRLHKIYIRKANIVDDKLPSIIPSNYNKSKYNTNYLDSVEMEYYNIWEWELERWEKFYDMDYRIVKTYYFYGEYAFKTWVQENKHLKENAKNDIDRQYYKTLLNTLYGKTGENYKRKHRVLVENNIDDLTGVKYGSYIEQPVVTESEILSYVPVTSAITAYARSELCDAIYANKDIFIYGDTDSIYCTEKPSGIPIHDTHFGKWKYEKRFTKFKFIKPKAYIAQLTHKYKKTEWVETDKLHIALAGLSKENHNLLNFSNFNKGFVLETGKKQKRNVKGGVILIETKYTL